MHGVLVAALLSQKNRDCEKSRAVCTVRLKSAKDNVIPSTLLNFQPQTPTPNSCVFFRVSHLDLRGILYNKVVYRYAKQISGNKIFFDFSILRFFSIFFDFFDFPAEI